VDARKITLSIEGYFENVSLVGVSVRGICDYLSLNETDAYGIEFSVVEAVNNVIKYAYEMRPGGGVGVVVTVEQDRMIIQVSDRGRAMIPKKPKLLDREYETIGTLPEGGMGLSMIHAIMDEVIYASRNGKNTLTMVKHLKRE
jgi:serine/threonine-protein kinase RsbW